MFLQAKPVGKQRARVNMATGRFYTPKKTRNFETEVALACYEWMKSINKKLTDKAVGVDIIIYVVVPKSWSKVKREKALSGEIRPVGRPDIDNVLKSILDGFQGVFYVNDQQVVESSQKRFYAMQAGVMVNAYEV